MAKPTIAEEVQVLRFFESGSIEKAQTVFNIVAEKMRERLEGSGDYDRSAAPGSPRKRKSPGSHKAHGVESAEPSSPE
jgi:hypothetical protein